MTTLYKLTNELGRTQGKTIWKIGTPVTLTKRVKSPQLCTGDVLHAYRDDILALLLNQGGYSPCRLFKARGTVVAADWDKVGCFSLTVTKELALPDWYTDATQRQRVQVAFAVLCAESVLHLFEQKYPKDERPRKAIAAAREYLRTGAAASSAAAAAAAAAAASYAAASYAAYAAAAAANSAPNAAYAAATAASYAAYAAAAAAYAANSALNAAYAAANSADAPDFAALARQAVTLAAEIAMVSA